MAVKDARVYGHALVWVAVTRAKCECGKEFKIPDDEAAGRADGTVQDWLMDEHRQHLDILLDRAGAR